MHTPPTLPPPPALPAQGQANPKTVRALGWVLVLIGPGLSVTTAIIAANLADTIHHSDRPGSLSHWHGGPEFTRTVFELLGAVFLLGIAICAGGVYQARTGRRHPVLVGIVLLLAAVTAYFVFGIISTRSPSA